MANKKHLEILKKGVKVWNEWRKRNPEERPNLSRADLKGAKLRGADLRRANLTEADLRGAVLNGADLRRADLSEAILWGADLIDTDLRRAELIDANLRVADLSGADLKGAVLIEANLWEADLSKANLKGANLWRANLSGANLSGANLSEAHIFATLFKSTYLMNTNFKQSNFARTTISDCDLSNTLGLASVSHKGPSTIGIDAILKSKGKIPVSFLKGCGVPDDVVKILLPKAKGRQFYTCFISYSTKDETFAAKLKKYLKAKQVRCWYFPEDAVWGKDVYENIDIAVKGYDKLIVVCSENSLKSKPVVREIERGLQKEQKEKKQVLFPITIDDYLFNEWDHHLKADLLSITIGDFKDWKNPDKYKEAFDKLLEGLQK